MKKGREEKVRRLEEMGGDKVIGERWEGVKGEKGGGEEEGMGE